MAKTSVDGSAWLEEETGGLAAAPKPRYRAEDLIYEAWQTAGPRRVKLARQALELWPDCADAYVLLAQAASDLERARALLEQGVAAGERAAGRRVFAQDAGEFWLIFERGRTCALERRSRRCCGGWVGVRRRPRISASCYG